MPLSARHLCAGSPDSASGTLPFMKASIFDRVLSISSSLESTCFFLLCLAEEFLSATLKTRWFWPRWRSATAMASASVLPSSISWTTPDSSVPMMPTATQHTTWTDLLFGSSSKKASAMSCSLGSQLGVTVTTTRSGLVDLSRYPDLSRRPRTKSRSAPGTDFGPPLSSGLFAGLPRNMA